jgi:hypothetical protein
MPTDKRSTTYRLSEEARTLLERLADHHGINQTAVLEMAIREKARRDLLAEPAQPPPKKKARKT